MMHPVSAIYKPILGSFITQLRKLQNGCKQMYGNHMAGCQGKETLLSDLYRCTRDSPLRPNHNPKYFPELSFGRACR
jgi:hypothetical protein